MMYLSIFVSEMPIVPDLKGGQRVYVRVDGPLNVTELTDATMMDQIIRDFWTAASEKFKSKQQSASAGAPPADASPTGGS